MANLLQLLDSLKEAFNLLSLALTVPLMVLAWFTVYHWGKAAIRLHGRLPSSWSPFEWFIVGVVCTFAGSFVDNLYWGVAWLCYYLDWESAGDWFGYGVFSNVPFRQVAGVLAGYCHVRSAYGHIRQGDVRGANRILILSFLAGVLAAVALFCIRHPMSS